MPLLDLTSIPLIQAANYTPAARKGVDWIVLHTMESQEKPGTARRVAEWFAGPNAPQASAHYCIDQNETWRCVRDEDIAWHAPGANSRGIGIEHAGRAGQTPAEWADGFSMATLERSIALCAALCRKWSIPAELVAPGDLQHGVRGITTHDWVTKAFRKSTHTDPGPNFPLLWYTDRVWHALREAA